MSPSVWVQRAQRLLADACTCTRDASGFAYAACGEVTTRRIIARQWMTMTMPLESATDRFLCARMRVGRARRARADKGLSVE